MSYAFVSLTARLATHSSSNLKTVFFGSYQSFGQYNAASGSETYKFAGKPYSQTTGLYYNYHPWDVS